MRTSSGPGSWARPALILLTLAYLILIGWMAQRPVQTDFAKFYSSARLLLAGKDIYSRIEPEQLGLEAASEAAQDWRGVHPNLNPPFAALLTAPLGLLSFPVAFWVWSLLSLFSGALAVRLLTGNGYDSELNYSSWLLVLFGYFPTWVNFKYGQVSLFLLLALTLMLRLARADKDWRAGALFGATVGVKLFTGLFLLFFLVRHRWLLLLAAALTGLACWGAALAAADWEAYDRYREALYFVTWQAANWNASFNGLFSRIFGGSESVPLLEGDFLSRPLASVSSVLATLTLVWAISRGTDDSQFDLGFSLTIPLMLLISPLGWIYYFPLLLIPMAAAWRILPGDQRGKRLRTWLGAAWALTSLPSWFVTADLITPASVGFATGALHTLSLLFFTGVLVMILRSPRATAASNGAGA